MNPGCKLPYIWSPCTTLTEEWAHSICVLCSEPKIIVYFSSCFFHVPRLKCESINTKLFNKISIRFRFGMIFGRGVNTIVIFCFIWSQPPLKCFFILLPESSLPDELQTGFLLNISCVVKCFLVTVSPTEDLNVSTSTTIYYSKSESLCGFKTVDT